MGDAEDCGSAAVGNFAGCVAQATSPAVLSRFARGGLGRGAVPAAGYFILLAQNKVTKQKGTPLPRPFGLNLALPKKSGGRPNSGLKALRQVRPTAPDFFGKARRGRGEEKRRLANAWD